MWLRRIQRVRVYTAIIETAIIARIRIVLRAPDARVKIFSRSQMSSLSSVPPPPPPDHMFRWHWRQPQSFRSAALAPRYEILIDPWRENLRRAMLYNKRTHVCIYINILYRVIDYTRNMLLLPLADRLKNMGYRVDGNEAFPG